MPSGVIITRTARIWLRDDGIIQSVALSNVQQGLEDAQANMAAIAQLSAGKPRPVFVDMRAALGVDREARACYASGGGNARYAAAVALLVGSPVSRVIANFIISLNKPPISTRLFTSEAEAVGWLRKAII